MRWLAVVCVVVGLGCGHKQTVPPLCGDGIKNGSETDVDCGGGICPTCNSGRACIIDMDCRAKICASGVCTAATCSDGVLNGSESDIDCGGPDCAAIDGGACDDAKICAGKNDCKSGVCVGGTCQAPSCSDGYRNGGETKVDCGGPCPPCD